MRLIFQVYPQQGCEAHGSMGCEYGWNPIAEQTGIENDGRIESVWARAQFGRSEIASHGDRRRPWRQIE